MRWCVGFGLSLCLVACAPAVSQREATVQRPRAAAPAWEAGEQTARHERQVAVEGIEGTLSRYDVNTAMERHGEQFDGCREARARSVPSLAGKIEFKIHVLRSGKVSDVHVRASDLGDRQLERCLSAVIQGAKLPRPHGGEANVVYRMEFAPAQPGREPEQWERGRVERVLRKRRSELLQTCAAQRSTSFTVTAYVSPNGRKGGRVLAAGVAAPEAASPEQFDCIAEELRSWPMPRPRRGVAKVSFPLRVGA